MKEKVKFINKLKKGLDERVEQIKLNERNYSKETVEAITHELNVINLYITQESLNCLGKKSS